MKDEKNIESFYTTKQRNFGDTVMILSYEEVKNCGDRNYIEPTARPYMLLSFETQLAFQSLYVERIIKRAMITLDRNNDYYISREIIKHPVELGGCHNSDIRRFDDDFGLPYHDDCHFFRNQERIRKFYSH